MSTFSNNSSETTMPIKAKFHVGPPSDGVTKFCSNGLSHMTKLDAMSIYGKNFLRNQKAYDHEIWYVALGPRVLFSLFK